MGLNGAAENGDNILRLDEKAKDKGVRVSNRSIDHYQTHSACNIEWTFVKIHNPYENNLENVAFEIHPRQTFLRT
jgi:hypothetical protein